MIGVARRLLRLSGKAGQELPDDYINIDIEDKASIYAEPDASSSIVGKTGYMRTWIIGIYNEAWYLVMTRDG